MKYTNARAVTAGIFIPLISLLPHRHTQTFQTAKDLHKKITSLPSTSTIKGKRETIYVARPATYVARPATTVARPTTYVAGAAT